MKKKKSQMEIMGLVVIVILITLGMFFVVKFMINKPPSEIKKSYTRTELAANLLNTLLKTTSEDCYGMTVKDLLVDCAENKDTECENAKPSCEYVLTITKTIFDETLVKWGNQLFDLKAQIESPDHFLHCINGACIYQYNDVCTNCTTVDAGCFSYNGPGECVDIRNNCPIIKETKHSYIPTDMGTMTITLEVC